jgi:hypothetical protein
LVEPKPPWTLVRGGFVFRKLKQDKSARVCAFAGSIRPVMANEDEILNH